MATKIYGCSDDLIEVEGNVRGEVGCYGTDEREHGVMLICSDHTILEVKYGKLGEGIWEVRPLYKGLLFDRIDTCIDPDDTPYSDVAHFNGGLRWVYAATEWQKVK